MKALRILLAVAVLSVAGGVAYIYFSGGSGEPSTDLTTPGISSTITATTAGQSTVADGTTGTTLSPAAAFVIVPEESEASFELGEVLMGEDKRVVGTTSEVAGQVLFQPGDPAAAQFSEILINARTFATDRANRDRAMRSPVVLDSASDEHEFISFVPREIEGLEGPVAVGDEFTFEISGELTIKGTTRPVTFSVTAVLEAQDRLSGRAEAEVLRADFGIGIPRAPGVADVTEEVAIALDFVAVKA